MYKIKIMIKILLANHFQIIIFKDKEYKKMLRGMDFDCDMITYHNKEEDEMVMDELLEDAVKHINN